MGEEGREDGERKRRVEQKWIKEREQASIGGEVGCQEMSGDEVTEEKQQAQAAWTGGTRGWEPISRQRQRSIGNMWRMLVKVSACRYIDAVDNVSTRCVDL